MFMRKVAFLSCCGLIASLRALSAQSAAPASSIYSRYTPASCAELGLWTEYQWWRTQNPDTAAIAPVGYAVHQTTSTAVRDCIAQLSLAALPQDQLPGFAQAALLAAEPAKADSALTRLATIAAGSPVRTHAWLLLRIISVDLEGAESRFADADAYLSKLDALGAPASVERLLAYRLLANRAHLRDSVALESRALTAAIAATRTLTPGDRSLFGDHVAAAYSDMVNLLIRQNRRDSARTVLTAGRRALDSFGMSVVEGNRMNDARGILNGREPFLAPIGRHAPPIRATRWYNLVDTSLAADTTHPATGRPSVIIIDLDPQRWFVRTPYAIVRRLAEKYQSRGVDFTVTARTTGAWDWREVPPDSEMLLIRDFARTELKLPVTLAVSTIEFTREQNGMVTAHPDAVLSSYLPPEIPQWDTPLVAYVVDRRGLVRMVVPIRRVDETMLAHVLDELLREPVPPPPTK